jgi:hypothetical protein
MGLIDEGWDGLNRWRGRDILCICMIPDGSSGRAKTKLGWACCICMELLYCYSRGLGVVFIDTVTKSKLHMAFSPNQARSHLKSQTDPQLKELR